MATGSGNTSTIMCAVKSKRMLRRLLQLFIDLTGARGKYWRHSLHCFVPVYRNLIDIAGLPFSFLMTRQACLLLTNRMHAAYRAPRIDVHHIGKQTITRRWRRRRVYLATQGPSSLAEHSVGMMQFMNYMAVAGKPKAAYLVAKLGIADSLWPLGTQKTSQQVATELKLPKETIYRVMRLAGQAGLLTEHGKDTGFSLTDMGALLSTHHPSKARNFALLLSMPLPYRSVGCLYEAVTQGRPGVEAAFGEGSDFFELLYKDTEQLRVFNEAMDASLGFSTAAALSFDFSGCKKIVDVGGCQGALISAILKAKPELEGVNMDRPEVIAPLPPVESDLAGRLTHVAGDFFKPLPKETHGADAMILKFILHSWSDEQCCEILKNCMAASPHGKILVIDYVLPDTAGAAPGSLPFFPFCMDMVMMAISTGGCERTLHEWDTVFRRAGLSRPIVLYDKETACLLAQPVAAEPGPC